MDNVYKKVSGFLASQCTEMASPELSDSDLSDLYSFSRSPSPESDMEAVAVEKSLPEPVVMGKEKKKKKKLIPGVVYLSRIPPYMKPHKLKCLLSPYGKVGNVFLQPEGKQTVKLYQYVLTPSYLLFISFSIDNIGSRMDWKWKTIRVAL